MLRLTLALLALLSLSNCFSRWIQRPRLWLSAARRDAPSQWELRQRFLLDLLLQVHKPLLQQQLIEMGRQLNSNPDDYNPGTWPLVVDFIERVQQDRMLKPFANYDQLEQELPQKLLAAFHFLTLARDWHIFQRNACYARIHLHPVLFVNALQLAIGDRADASDLLLPDMHEVLPQLYFDRRVVLAAQQIDWQQLSPFTRISWRETLSNVLFRQRAELQFIPSDPLIIEVQPAVVQLSLDVTLGSHWNRLLNRHLIDQQERHLLQATFIESMRRVAAHLQFEKLTLGSRSWETELVTTGGVPYRSTTYHAEAVRHLISATIAALRREIDKQLQAGAVTDRELLKCTVGRLIATRYWQICRHLSRALNGDRTEPHLMAMGSSNLRDPIYRELLLQLDQLMAEYDAPLVADVKHLEVRRVHVGELETFEQPVDCDLINLLDQQLLQTRRNNLQLLRRHLVARQHLLNHKSFNMTIEIFARTSTAVGIRTFLLPSDRDQPRLQLDEFDAQLTVGENRLQRAYPEAANGFTLSELYEARQPLSSTDMYSFPQHLLLPRGTAAGLKLRLLVQILTGSGPVSNMDCAKNTDDDLIYSQLLDVIVRHRDVK
ncbi:hypothetical protein KR222_010476 [Zaprionus bogoriensis]|nr:hypothetical protein KR222_010476 [Zaprionus bogoriensis]